jgi:hypothetical protein
MPPDMKPEHNRLELDWLRESIENNPERLPDQWDKIADKLYLEESWLEVSAQLEAEALWPQVQKKLATAERTIYIEKISRRAVAAFILMFGIGTIYLSQITPEAQKQNQFLSTEPENSLEETLVETQKSYGGRESQMNSSDGSNSKSLDSRTTKLQGAVETISPDNYSSLNEIGENGSNTYHTAHSIPNENFVLLSTLRGQLIPLDINSTPVSTLTNTPDSAMSDSGIQLPVKNHFKGKWVALGISGGAKMGWMMNYKTQEALQSSSLVSTKPGLSSHLGLTAEYAVTHRLNLSGELHWNKWNQVYQEYSNGFFGESKQVINSYRGSILANTRLSKNFGFSGMAGLAFSYNHSMYEVRGSDKIYLENSYRPYALGSIIGLEYNIPVNSAWSFGYGLRFYYDLTNLYQPNFYNTYQVDPFKRTSLDFNVTIKRFLNNY